MSLVPRWGVLVLGLVLPAAAHAAAADSVDARQGIDAGNRGFIEAWVKRDARAFASLFTPDGAMLLAGGRVIQGRKNIEARMAGVFKRLGMKDGSIVTTNVVLLDGMAYESGRWSFRFQPDSGAAEADSGRYVVLWKRAGKGHWLIHRDMGVK